MIAYWIYLISCQFQVTEHNCPLHGHTVLPSDEDFIMTENSVRKHVSSVYVWEDWFNIFKKGYRKLPMQLNQFHAFISLKHCTDMKRHDNFNILCSDVSHLWVAKDELCIYEVCTSYSNGIWEEINVAHRRYQRAFTAICCFYSDNDSSHKHISGYYNKIFMREHPHGEGKSALHLQSLA